MKVSSNKLSSTHNNKIVLLIIYKMSMMDNIKQMGEK